MQILRPILLFSTFLRRLWVSLSRLFSDIFFAPFDFYPDYFLDFCLDFFSLGYSLDYFLLS